MTLAEVMELAPGPAMDAAVAVQVFDFYQTSWNGLPKFSTDWAAAFGVRDGMSGTEPQQRLFRHALQQVISCRVWGEEGLTLAVEIITLVQPMDLCRAALMVVQP